MHDAKLRGYSTFEIASCASAHARWPRDTERKLRVSGTDGMVKEAAEAALQAISLLPIPSESSMKGGD